MTAQLTTLEITDPLIHKARLLQIQFEGHVRAAVETYWEFGNLLTQAKQEIGHGQWLIRLESAGIKSRTAQHAMKFSREFTKAQSLRFSSVQQAFQTLEAPIPKLPERLEPADGVIVRLRISEIVLAADLRRTPCPENIARLQWLLERGIELDPVIVNFNNVLLDGFMRIEAYRNLHYRPEDFISAEYRNAPSWEECYIARFQLNDTPNHGMPLTVEEMERGEWRPKGG